VVSRICKGARLPASGVVDGLNDYCRACGVRGSVGYVGKCLFKEFLFDLLDSSVESNLIVVDCQFYPNALAEDDASGGRTVQSYISFHV
jgi:hypothetical protein